jgi:anti-anti-sigma factor
MEELPDFRVSKDGVDGRFILSGELDVSCSDGLVEVVRPAIEQGIDITFDASDLRFIDSSGIRALLTISRELRGRGRVVVAHPSSSVRRTLEIVGADSFPNFEIS